MRIKICRKESKESAYWLRLARCAQGKEDEHQKLMQEGTELMKMFGAIITKSISRDFS